MKKKGRLAFSSRLLGPYSPPNGGRTKRGKVGQEKSTILKENTSPSFSFFGPGNDGGFGTCIRGGGRNHLSHNNTMKEKPLFNSHTLSGGKTQKGQAKKRRGEEFLPSSTPKKSFPILSDGWGPPREVVYFLYLSRNGQTCPEKKKDLARGD